MHPGLSIPDSNQAALCISSCSKLLGSFDYHPIFLLVGPFNISLSCGKTQNYSPSFYTHSTASPPHIKRGHSGCAIMLRISASEENVSVLSTVSILSFHQKCQHQIPREPPPLQCHQAPCAPTREMHPSPFFLWSSLGQCQFLLSTCSFCGLTL